MQKLKSKSEVEIESKSLLNLTGKVVIRNSDNKVFRVFEISCKEYFQNKIGSWEPIVIFGVKKGDVAFSMIASDFQDSFEIMERK